MGVATGHARASAGEFEEPPLDDLEMFVPEDDLALLPYFARGVSFTELVQEFAAALAVVGDWPGLDELAAAAVQTFLQAQPPSFGG